MNGPAHRGACDRGAAAVWAAALTFALMLASFVSLAAAQQALVRQRVATAADLAAIAAAQATDDPCGQARSYAERNGAHLTDCRVDLVDDRPNVEVGVSMPPPELVVRLLAFLGRQAQPVAEKARAGPPEPDDR